LLVAVQKQQMAHLKVKFEAESKELKQNQTKKSMDDSRGIQQDKNIKTKNEQERRVRELKEKNVSGCFTDSVLDQMQIEQKTFAQASN
jgi:hypothetical protein